MVNVAILGFGVVGSGAAEVLTDNRRVIEKNLGKTIDVRGIVDYFDGTYQIKVFSRNDIVVHE